MTPTPQTYSVRELAKSALSLSWAISLLGITKMPTPLDGMQAGNNLFASFTRATTEQLDDFLKDIHRSGTSFQSRVVDSVFSLGNPATLLNPATWSIFFPQINFEPKASVSPTRSEDQNK